MLLFTLGLWVLLLWTLRDVWYYGLFGTVADLRVWLLARLSILLAAAASKTGHSNDACSANPAIIFSRR